MGKSTSTVQQYTPSAQAMSTYGGLLSQAQTLGSQPYQPYNAPLVAGLSPTQQTGISNVNAASGVQNPYLAQAQQYAASGAAPVSSVGADDISKYFNPYQSNVINSTMANIRENNQQQQSSLLGNAAAQGALGGDRSRVAQAELARQQNLASNQTLAGLQSQGYSQALTEANSQQQNAQANAARQAQAAYTFGNLGTTAQNSALTGANAQLQAGGLEQQNQQQQLSAAYQQFMRQQAFPYQQLGFTAGISAPIAGALGGTQTTQGPPPNPFSQILGGGLAASALFGNPLSGLSGVLGAGSAAGGMLASGGRVPEPMADGGVPSFIDADGYVPKFQPIVIPKHDFGSPNTGQQTNPLTQSMDMMKSFGLSPFSQKNAGDTSNSSTSTGTLDGYDMNAGFRGLYADGGFVNTVHALRKSLRHYDDGGFVGKMGGNPFGGGADDEIYDPRKMARTERILPPATFEDRFPMAGDLPVRAQQADARDAFRNVGNTRAYEMAGIPVPRPRPEMTADNPALAANDAPAIAPEARAALPTQFTENQFEPDEAMSYAPRTSPFSRMKAAAPGTPVDENSLPGGTQPELSFLDKISQPFDAETKTGLLAAGLGMLAGTSPYAGVNIGTGGLQGVQAVMQQRKAQQDTERRAEELAIKKEHSSIEGRRLAQQAEIAAKTDTLHRDQMRLNEMKPIPTGKYNTYGQPILGVRDPKTGLFNDPLTGKPLAPDEQPASVPNFVVPGPTQPATPSPSAPAPTGATPLGAKPEDEAAIPAKAIYTAADLPAGKEYRPEALASEKPADAAIIKAIAEGRQRALPQTRGNIRNQHIMEKVHEYDPAYEEGLYGSRTRTLNNFSSGFAAKQITNINTGLQHFEGALRAAEKLNGLPQPMRNKIIQAVAEGGWASVLGPKWQTWTKETQEAISDFMVKKRAVAGEIAKITVGGPTASRDREEWQRDFDPTNSIDKNRKALGSAMDLLTGRLSSITGEYNTGMRTNHEPIEMLRDPKARERYKKLKKLGGESEEETPQPATPANAAPVAPPRPAGVPDGSDYSPSRKAWRTPDGKIIPE